MNRLLSTNACAVLFIFFFLVLPSAGRAQNPVAHRNRDSISNTRSNPDEQSPATDRPGYWSIDVTAIQLSLANVHNPDAGTSSLSIPRLTCVLNVAALYNYDISENFGFYTGAAITNLGVIIKSDGVKYKRRIYTLGIPLAFKLGSLKYANFYAGLQVDWALQYQEKHKVGDTVISKFGEWGSDRTSRILGSWFIGGELLHTLDWRIQSYFTNFFNRDYTDATGAKPYSNIIARPLLLTFGFNFITGKKYTFRTHHRTTQ
ncbi:MAG TPA: hypothetical protein VGM30_01305 [Puia sp.]|jgi:hypothetical protein